MNPPGINELQDLIVRIINLVVGLGFMALVAMLVLAGVKWITSGGEAKSVESARMTLVWALLGMLFLALGWLFLVLIRDFTGVDVTHFCIKFSGC